MTSSNVRAAGGDVKIAVVATRTIVGVAANSGASDPSAQPRHGCQMVISKLLDCMRFALRA